MSFESLEDVYQVLWKKQNFLNYEVVVVGVFGTLNQDIIDTAVFWMLLFFFHFFWEHQVTKMQYQITFETLFCDTVSVMSRAVWYDQNLI